jgi:Ca2+-binding RTX toxin-like protein
MRPLLLATLCLLAAAPPAVGSTVEKAGDTITYTAALGEENDLDVSDDGAGNYRFDETGPVSISTTTCAGGAMAAANCSDAGVNRIVIVLRDQDDRQQVITPLSDRLEVDGGTGVDDIEGANESDEVDGGPGADFVDGDAGDDVVHGGDGSDLVRGGLDADQEFGDGGDDIFIRQGTTDDTSGGAGFDTMLILGGGMMVVVPQSVPFSLDDVANDALAPFFQNVRSDVEALDAAFIEGPSPQSLTLIGNDGPNSLRGGLANDTIDGRGGVDVLNGFDGDDQLLARDGGFDLVLCGVGTDSAVVDAADDVRDCESVDRAAPPAVAAPVVEDRPPTVGFVTPITGALLDPSRANVVTVAAGDDRGIAQVLLFDDGRLIGADAVAPYALSYAPTGDDVGRNTLVAIAVDTAQQTATDQRATRLGLFTPPRPTAVVSPTRDRRAPYRFVTTGRVRLAVGVTPALGCSEGEVAVQVKRGRRTISTRRVGVRRNCTFQSTVTFADRSRLGNGRLSIVARFLGNDVMRAVSAAARAVRAG